MTKDRIRGMFLGIAIGDALGMPVETFSAVRIAETYGRVTTYLVPDGHKWFNGHKAGTYTDDTQLSLAVAEALIEGDLDMECQVKHHVAALRETTAGWGNTTRNSIRRLANGTPWTSSGSGGDGSGTGNGVPMKIAPVGAVAATGRYINEFILSLNAMTHRTSISSSAALLHAFSVRFFLELPEGAFANDKSFSFVKDVYFNLLLGVSKLGEEWFPETLTDNLTDRMTYLAANYETLTTPEIIEQFGGGSCYCFNSVPFTYAFFLKNPYTIDSLYDVISAGGDTDSNGSMLGSLLGALHGTAIFPQVLVDGLVDRDKILDVADRFAEKFGFK